MYNIKVGSITYAQRANKVLGRNNIKSSITRIKNPKATEGCGYAIKVNSSNIDALCELLRENGIRVVGVDEL